MPIIPSIPAFYLAASAFEVLRVSGADAEKFLQGQLSCDVAALADNSFCYGTACNTKGRIISPFLMLRQQQDFLLVFNGGLAGLFTAALKKFLPFYKCSMTPATECCLAFGGQDSSSALAALGASAQPAGSLQVLAQGVLLTLSNEPAGHLLLQDQGSAPAALSALPADDGSLWQALQMLRGHYPFAVADSEQFTPQELQYDSSGYVSFTKGCYTGQEIVARMHYRGKVKRQLYLVRLPLGAAPTEADLSLLDAAGTKLAQCSKAVKIDSSTHLALAVLPVEFPDRQLGTASGLQADIQPLQPLS